MLQTTTSKCTELDFVITSQHSLEELTLYAEGPCRNIGKSQKNLLVIFSNCTCPVGFQQIFSIESNCVCDCDPRIKSYITKCDSQKQTLTRDGNFWISYLNVSSDAHEHNYITYPYCPLDYCVPPSSRVKINLNTVDGSDVQCADNRSGMLCGECQPGLSLSLGSSKCVTCEGVTNLIVFLFVSFLAGIALVAILLTLNLTVAIGTLNGLIFYANIVGSTSSAFFPSSSTKAPYVFISWLNLELGFDTCFFVGMDTYWKTWFQLAFPTYLIFLVVIVIAWSERSIRLARLIGRKNPVATLATLILFSYTNFLGTVITSLSFATLEYPHGFQKRVWLPQASVEYLHGRHIALIIVAILILLAGAMYTFLILFWQWILKHVKNINLHLKHFIETYHAPYRNEHRYWTGLLLFVRLTLYLAFALNVSGDPGVNLVGIIVVTCALLFLKGFLGQLYKNWKIDVIEMVGLLNVALFSAAQLFILKSGKDHTANAYISVFIAALVLFLVVVYHIYTEVVLNIKSKIASRNNDCNCLGVEAYHNDGQVQETSSSSSKEITYSVIDPPGCDEDLENTACQNNLSSMPQSVKESPDDDDDVQSNDSSDSNAPLLKDYQELCTL